MDKARAYVGNWNEAYRENTGLLLFDDVGTGKSLFAGCIANALIDRDIPVLMTNIPAILNRLTGMFAEDRSAFISGLDDYSLLILDDLGVERNTEYALEQMFLVIDSRYRSRKPLIVTTNLKLEEIKNPPTWPMRESMTAYWNGAPLSSLPGRIFGRKTPRPPKRRQRGLYPQNETID